IRMNGVGRAASRDFPFSFAHVDDGHVARFIDVDAVLTGTKHGESELVSINLDGFILSHEANPEAESAFGQANLGDAIIKFEKGKTGLLVQTNPRRSNVEFRASALIGPKLIARGDRTIHNRGNPIVGA